ncbi:MAG: class I SAM-dependent RNA methyltransferase [Lentihominibacter sp.]
MKKGMIVELTIEDMSDMGQGIGREVAGGTEGTAEKSSTAEKSGMAENSGTDEKGGMVVFVPDTVPGDRVRAEITKVKKRYAFGRLVEMLEPSDCRAEDVCPYAVEGCGGCPLAGIEYSAQAALKEKQVRSKLQRLAGVEEDFAFSPIAAAEEPYCYRNKAVMPISTGGLITKKGGIQEPVHEPRIGFRPARSNNVIDCEECRIQAPTAMAAAMATRQFMTEDNITSYDPRWDKGLMHEMTVKTAFGTGEVMVIYDINGKGIPNAAKLIGYLDDAVYEAGGSLESVILRTRKGSKTKTETLAGKPTITDIVEIEAGDGVREYTFEISAESFYQVNHMQMQKLYGVVRDYCRRAAGEIARDDASAAGREAVNAGGGDVAKTDGGDAAQTAGGQPVIWDLYCGIGTIGLSVADLAEQVKGVELVKEAIIDANRNATINGIVNAVYEQGKAEELIPKWVQSGEHADIAIIDPPRAGCRPELLSAIARAGVPYIVYVSCDPATLARDIRLLKEGFGGEENAGAVCEVNAGSDCGLGSAGESGAAARYELVAVTPVDLFPHTSHVETCCLLRRQA